MRISWRPPSQAGVVLVAGMIAVPGVGGTHPAARARPPAGPALTISVSDGRTVANPGDQLTYRALTNTVTSAAPGSNCPAGSTDPRCTSTVPVAILTINSTADVSTTTPGGVVHYTTTLTNTGQVRYEGITMSSDASGLIDDAAGNGDQTATSGTLVIGTTGAVWTGDIPVGGTVTITGSVTVNNPDTGDHVLTETNTSDAPGSNCPDGSTDPRCGTTIDVLTPALTITKTANTTAAVPGATVTYTITVADTGQTPYTGAVVTDSLDSVLRDAAYNNDAAATSGTLSYASPNLTWTGDLTPGQAATITYTVTVNNPDTGGKLMVNFVTSTDPGSTCPFDSPSPGCAVTIPVLTPALTIVKTASAASAVPGQKVTYTITVTNTGQVPYTGAVVTDDLTGLLDDATYGADAAATRGAVSYASPVLTWTGNLTPGQAATITYTVTVDNPETSDRALTNTVTSAAAVPGSTVGYTITVHDTGQTPYTSATVTDSLTGVLGDAAYNHDAAATSGTVSYASPVLTWTGDLAPGDTATITYTVTVNNPDTGGGALSNTVVSAVPGSTCPAGSTDPGCAVTVAVVAGPLTITVPATASLGSAPPGGTLGSGLGTVQVTDDRGFGADWTATVASTGFATGTGTQAETIPAADARYLIAALIAARGPATFTPVPAIQLSASPQAVVSATNVSGNTSVSWDPTIQVSVPSAAISGDYTATITHSVS